MKKGQTATEYLIILGIVIVLTLIVVGVMGGFPNPLEKKNESEITKDDVGIWFCSKKEMDFIYQRRVGFFGDYEMNVYCRKIESNAEIIENNYIIEFPLAKEIMMNEGWKREIQNANQTD